MKFNLEIAFELTELGAELVAQKYRRDNPDASEDEVAEAVSNWYRDRSKAPHGDGVGKPATWPRSR